MSRAWWTARGKDVRYLGKGDMIAGGEYINRRK
jgi:hypothetical protein